MLRTLTFSKILIMLAGFGAMGVMGYYAVNFVMNNNSDPNLENNNEKIVEPTSSPSVTANPSATPNTTPLVTPKTATPKPTVVATPKTQQSGKTLEQCLARCYSLGESEAEAKCVRERTAVYNAKGPMDEFCF